MTPKSPYYMDTGRDLENGEYVSLQHQLSKFSDHPFFDTEHAKTEILKAIKDR